MHFKKHFMGALCKKKGREYHAHGLESAINNLASKTSSFLKKKCRSSDLDKYHAYQRLAECHHHDQEDDDDEAETIDKDRVSYVPVYVGKEAKRYDVPLAYLSLPRFRQMMRQSRGEDEGELNTNRPIILNCSTEAFDLLLELCSFE